MCIFKLREEDPKDRKERVYKRNQKEAKTRLAKRKEFLTALQEQNH
jgi:hypothetical protein